MVSRRFGDASAASTLAKMARFFCQAADMRVGMIADRVRSASRHVAETVPKPLPRNVGSMDVEVLRWPKERTRRASLRDVGCPRILLVDPVSNPPVCTDPLEDWAYADANPVEIDVRTQSIRLRAEAALGRTVAPPPPDLDSNGVLRVGSSWVALPPLEARLAVSLLEEPGAVVSRDALTLAGWPDGTSDRNSLDVHIMRLRRRIAPLGVTLRTVRSRGYALQI